MTGSCARVRLEKRELRPVDQNERRLSCRKGKKKVIATRSPTRIRNCPPMKGADWYNRNRGPLSEELRRHGARGISTGNACLVSLTADLSGIGHIPSTDSLIGIHKMRTTLVAPINVISISIAKLLIGRPMLKMSHLIRRRSWFDEMSRCGASGLGATAELGVINRTPSPRI